MQLFDEAIELGLALGRLNEAGRSKRRTCRTQRDERERDEKDEKDPEGQEGFGGAPLRARGGGAGSTRNGSEVGRLATGLARRGD